MRRMMMLAVMPLLCGLLWAVACERSDYRHVLPLRPLDGAAGPQPDLARPADPPPDMVVPPDMPSPPDMAKADM